MEKHEAILVLEKFRETGIYDDAFELVSALDIAIELLKTSPTQQYNKLVGFECWED